MKYTPVFASLLSALVLTTACKKEDSLVRPTSFAPSAPVDNSSLADKLKDSAALIAKDLYLWYDKIPASFSGRTFSDPPAVMQAIRQYAIEPGFSTAVDRWSFGMEQKNWNQLSAGVSGDFGLTVFFRQDGDLRVRAVEPASPAGRAGVRRGWRITRINGNSDLTTANSNFIIQQVYQSGSSSFSFQKPDGSTVNMSFDAAFYQDNPIVLDTVYNTGGKKVGYFVFGSFLGDTTAMFNAFSRIASGFSGQGITDLIVDLRYNGGGYVSVARQLAEYLAPSAANGGVMMTQRFNQKYAQYNSTDYFRKRGPLNLSRIVFIVSSSTASASELLINSLKPYMDVVLVGPSKTHGKPVGYFPVPVGNWYVLPVSFFTVNKNGEGNYYGGLPLTNQSADGLDKDWGDLTESSLASAVSFVTTGAFRSSTQGRTTAPQAEAPAVRAGNLALEEPHFKGAIDVRHLR